ncbi:hypothetical protein [Bradyrhizobium sp. USDA 4520]
MSSSLRDGTFPRLGYLPSGTVVNLEEPYADSKDSFKKQHCGFHFRDAIAGQIDRKHITKLAETIRSANLDDLDAVIISPSNPNPEKALSLYERQDAPSKVVAKLTRVDRAIILASARDLKDGADTIKVRYTSDLLGHAPRFSEAYVRTEDDRTRGYDGTFRIFRPFVPTDSSPPERGRDSWFDSLKRYLVAFVSPAGNISTVVDGLKRHVGLGSCGHSEIVKVELEAKAGAETKIVGMSTTIEGTLEWKKPEDKAVQYAKFGSGKDFALTVAGTAQCSGEYPAYLERVHIVIGDPGPENRDFVVDREEIFEVFSEDATTKKLKEKARRISTKRDKTLGLTQMIFVPAMRADSGLYYTYFDRLEKFMYDDVFQTPLAIDEEDKYALTLLVGEVLTYWEASNTPIFRGRRTS